MKQDDNDIQRTVYDLARRFSGMERDINDGKIFKEEYQEEIRAWRVANGLPVSTLLDRLLARSVPKALALLVADGQHKTTPAITVAARVVSGVGRVVVLAGGAGRGKSVAGAWLLANRPGRWVHAPDLATPESVNGAARLEDSMRQAAVLVLDDVGTEHSPSGYAASRINDIIVWREANGKPTLITTNLSMNEFKNRYGERVASRINGDSVGWQTVTGPDMRTQEKK